MRVIIEADTSEEIERLMVLLERLKSDLLRDKAVTVRRPPSQAERQVILQKLFDTVRIPLPADWKFDRDEANER